MPKVVTRIEPTINPLTRLPQGCSRKRRVAAYARVSTDQEEQQTSYEAQVDYYTGYINRRPDWELVGIYTDEGISGTNTKRREGFKRMIDDALNGKIDLIITKSISRFARNTVDSLVNIRKLKEHNVECYFEKENINTFDSKGELLITIMSSLAQEESRSISQNVTWGQRKRFADGKVSMPYKSFLGYKKGWYGKIEIDEEEAKIVRYIYFDFMSGATFSGIAKELNVKRVKTPTGKGRWTSNTILSILQNEKYKGDALLQKRFVVDFLEHKIKKNEGEVAQYYVKDSHPAIVPKEDWELVQIEIARRKKLRYNYSKKNPFLGKLVCEDCGGYYGRKIWHSNDAKRRKEVLQCNDKFKRKCRTPTFDEDEVKAMFLKAYNSMFVNKEETVSDIEFVKDRLTDTRDIDIKISRLNAELEKLAKGIETLVKENTWTVKDQEIWKKKYAELEDSYKNKVSSLDDLMLKKKEKILKGNRIDAFIELIRKGEILAEFDERIFNLVLDRAVVHHDASITFMFLSGEEITIKVGEE